MWGTDPNEPNELNQSLKLLSITWQKFLIKLKYSQSYLLTKLPYIREPNSVILIYSHLLPVTDWT